MRDAACHRCGDAPILLPAFVPLTPMTFWAGRSLAVWLCPVCLHDCRGSLLYRFGRNRWNGFTAEQRRLWLESLNSQDRKAFEGGSDA